MNVIPDGCFVDVLNPIVDHPTLRNGLVAVYCGIPGLTGSSRVFNVLRLGDKDGLHGTRQPDAATGPQWVWDGKRWGLRHTANGQHAQVAGVPYLGNGFTLGARLKLDTLGRFHGIIGRAASIWSDVEYAFRVENNNLLAIMLGQAGSGGADVIVTTAVTVGTEEVFVAATWDRQVVIIWIDAEPAVNANFSGTLHQSASNVSIGSYTLGLGLDFNLRGAVYDLLIYNRALSPSEIYQLSRPEFKLVRPPWDDFAFASQQQAGGLLLARRRAAA